MSGSGQKGENQGGRNKRPQEEGKVRGQGRQEEPSRQDDGGRKKILHRQGAGNGGRQDLPDGTQ